MTVRKIEPTDADNFFRMLCKLDEETDYMLYEPGERKATTKNTGILRQRIENASQTDLLLVSCDDKGRITGFIWAEKGSLNRTKHTAYIVVGVRKAHRRKGIGTEFFNRLDKWASENGVTRLELTVERENIGAIKLYEAHGFTVEGIRKKSMKVDGEYVDELYMSKIM